MKLRHLLALILLAGIWGASFPLMRVAAPQFGVWPMAAVRVAGATLVLMPVLALRGQWPALRRHWRAILLMGVTNSALPFACYALAALAISGGMSSILNAATPLFTALIAAVWLSERLGPARMVGLAIGFGGVAFLAGDQASLKANDLGVSPALAIAACLCATLLYGFSANYAKRRLSGVPTIVLSAGSQAAAALALAGPALLRLPSALPAPNGWLAIAALAVVCTGLAYLMYFRLIADVGPSKATTVTFLMPMFSGLWGWLFLGEAFTTSMGIGCGAILLGTALSIGLLSRRE